MTASSVFGVFGVGWLLLWLGICGAAVTLAVEHSLTALGVPAVRMNAIACRHVSLTAEQPARCEGACELTPETTL